MERIELNDGLRIDADGAGIIVKQDADGRIEISVVTDGFTVAELAVAVVKS